MNAFLKACRPVPKKKNRAAEIRNTLFVILAGLVMGLCSKGLELIPYNDAYVWSLMLESVDLRNVFSRLSVWALLALAISLYSKRPLRASLNVFCFFAAMLCGYYFLTITAAGFFPKSYIIRWAVITLFTPLLAFFAWYAKGKGWLAVLLSAAILGFFFAEAFSFGLWYMDVSYFPELLFLVIAAGMLLREKKQVVYTLFGMLIFAPVFQWIIPYVFGGL